MNNDLRGRLQLILVLSITAALLQAGCKAWPEPGVPSDLGPRIGFDLQTSVQKMSDGENQDDVAVYDESAMVSGFSLLEFAWGMEGGAVFFEPAFYVGNGSGMIDNGLLIGIADAEFDTYDGSALGLGFKSRVTLAETLVRVGLDARYLQFDGESEFKVDNLPALDTKVDATTKHLEILAVIDYNDPHYRPFFGVGFFGFFNDFESQDGSGDDITINTNSPFGAQVGMEFHSIGDSGFYTTLELGYFGGGPMLALGGGYRF
jgi:hypothetical protein